MISAGQDQHPTPLETGTSLDAIVIGAGLAGLFAARDNDLSCSEADEAARDAWVEHVNEVANATLFPVANSWYLGANIPGKPQVFMPYIGCPAYVEKCQQVVANGYEGFHLS